MTTLTTTMTWRRVIGGVVLAVAIAGCGATLNGKSFGMGGGPAAGGGPSGTGTSGASATAGTAGDGSAPAGSASASACFAPGDIETPPIASAPVDPWLAVAGDQPALTDYRPQPRDESDCSALHDHCLRDCAWFKTNERFADTGEATEARPFLYRPDGGVGYLDGVASWNDDVAVGYRTVPATKRTLTPGVIVVGAKFPQRVPAGERADWVIGHLDRVDWASGKVYLKGKGDPVFLSAARVAVLAYKKGGKVEILDGRSRDALAVRVDELFMPTAAVAVKNDPWSQVGADGQPKEVVDTVPFEDANVVCGAANDGCLRPWVWLVDVGGDRLWPARFQGGQMLSMNAIDQTTPLTDHRGAYRTVVATAAQVKVGTKVYIPRSLTSRMSEREVHTGPWQIVSVDAVGTDGTFTVRGQGTFRIEAARLPVLYWYPGSKVEKVE